ncbi:MAG TPA: hypothetical protein VFZ65_01755 [Planctomycetota bacterium]|nr:hypothetical protein [Planctomycetota bacterium]
MRPVHSRAALGGLLALAACSTAAPVPWSLQQLLQEAPDEEPARIWLEGNTIVAAAVALGPGALPADVRTTLDAIAPRGELVFQGREWGERGAGYRIEKRYREGVNEQERSVLIDTEGRVLERSHTWPIGDVPQHVLVAAMQAGTQIEAAWIVSGAEREEYWACTVRNRLGQTFVVRIGLDGRWIGAVRRVQASVHV